MTIQLSLQLDPVEDRKTIDLFRKIEGFDAFNTPLQENLRCIIDDHSLNLSNVRHARIEIRALWRAAIARKSSADVINTCEDALSTLDQMDRTLQTAANSIP